MDIFTYIRSDHRRIAGLIDQLLGINLSYVRMGIFSDIRTELTLHAQAEQQTFYRAIEAAAQSGDLQERMAHAEHDHQEIDDLLDVLGNTPISSDFWMEKFGELKHAIEHHVAEEEGAIFPRAQVLLTPLQCRTLARAMDEAKAELRQTLASEPLLL